MALSYLRFLLKGMTRIANTLTKELTPLTALPHMPLSVSLVLRGSVTALRTEADRQAATTASGLTAELDFALMSRTARGVPHQETMTSVLSPSNAPPI